MAPKGATANLLLLSYNYSLAVKWRHVPAQDAVDMHVQTQHTAASPPLTNHVN